MQKLFLIGYENSDAERLVETLVNVGIEVLADVRELPLSRKKGLSKRSLAERLESVGIEYTHYRELGDPKPGREAARSGDYGLFEKVFLRHLNTEEAQASLEKLLIVAKNKITCMLCYEKCSNVCHRSYLADEAALRGFEIFNLVADRPLQYLDDDIQIPRYHPRKGLAAAE